MSISFEGKVAVVTGAGIGLGRSHAMQFAARGAKVVVNDLGPEGLPSESSLAVVAEIEAAGGEAMAHGANVANMEQVEDMVKQAMDKWGRIDILVNNAGILRDKSFGKMTLDEFRLVVDVHLMGSVNCTKAVWDIMKAQNYGRIVMTSSSSGIFGNFGQANYSAAKMAVIGLMNTLSIEGQKNNIHVNGLAPTALTQMTEGLMPENALDLLGPETVTPAVLFLCSEQAPTKCIMGAGAGTFAVSRIYETDGVWLPEDQQSPEGIAANWDKIYGNTEQKELAGAWEQTLKFVTKSAEGQNLDLG
jgi:NAD(P)-dependent dehydrogenase (short-subunit alcohol dehydrogenase family)